MNIFEYNDKEFDKILNEVFDNIDENVLKRQLMECGLIFTKAEQDQLIGRRNDMWTEWIETIPLDVEKTTSTSGFSIEDYFSNKEDICI